MQNPQKLTTEPYKGVRDFYPDDMAIQRYIFDTWSKTAESFGFERYDASILEPSDLYKAKGAENEEMVNEQTYTFTDRGDREVTLRPEMTPTVARMVAAKRRELAFPLRWYSIPNLFRYERPQRGRLREFWQLNCDIFGGDELATDIETIALIYQILIDFGATPDMFEIQINNRHVYTEILLYLAKVNDEKITSLQINEIIRYADKINKVSSDEFAKGLIKIIGNKVAIAIIDFINQRNISEFNIPSKEKILSVFDGLNEIGIKNVKLNPALARGFDYYTGTIFEVFDTHPDNNRAMLGGGRYDNLTSMFGGEPISGIGFGMGDVPILNFLTTHYLLEDNLKPKQSILIIPMDNNLNLEAMKIATVFRSHNFDTITDISTKKINKKIQSINQNKISAYLVVGENELNSNQYVLKFTNNNNVIGPKNLDEIITELST